MIALMGPPPKELLDRGSTSATYFDPEGCFRHPKLIREDFSFESSITRFKGEDKELFIDFAKKMVCWLPEERWTANQLLQHPWLKEREKRDDGASPPASRPEGNLMPVDATVVTTKPTKETNSNRRSTNSSFFKNDVNTASSDVIRAILDR
jgi:serine/threonine protein kinase